MSARSGEESENAAMARRFIDAFNARDLNAFVATLHPEVEIHAIRGLRSGVEAAREWATRPPGGVQQRIVTADVSEHDDQVLVAIVREWWWEHEPAGEGLAGEDVMAWLFDFEDGLIRRWRAFDDREQARAAAGTAD